jgi:hypothetical protein
MGRRTSATITSPGTAASSRSPSATSRGSRRLFVQSAKLVSGSEAVEIARMGDKPCRSRKAFSCNSMGVAYLCSASAGRG